MPDADVGIGALLSDVHRTATTAEGEAVAVLADVQPDAGQYLSALSEYQSHLLPFLHLPDECLQFLHAVGLVELALAADEGHKVGTALRRGGAAIE